MSSSGSGEMTIYGGVPWTLTAQADSSPKTQTLTVYLEGTEEVIFQGSSGQSMTIQGTNSTEHPISKALRFRLLSWTFSTETEKKKLLMKASPGQPLRTGPLTATPGQSDYSDNPYFFTLPANTTVQLTAICTTETRQSIEYGVLTLPSNTFHGSKKDSAMKLSDGTGTSATVGPYAADTQIVALFTYKLWPDEECPSISSVGDAVTAGTDIVLTTIPSRHPMLINAVPPWCPLPIPISTETVANPSQHPVGHVTVGEAPGKGDNVSGNLPVVKATGSEIFQGNSGQCNFWWFPPPQFAGVGSLLNISRDVNRS